MWCEPWRAACAIAVVQLVSVAPGSSEITATPNPVTEGGTVSVTYQGEGTLYASVDGGAWEEVTLDSDGNGEVEAPVGSSTIVLSDRVIPGGSEEFIEVVSTGV